MVNDTVGDTLIRIKNGYLARKKEISVSYSKLNLAICKLLEKEGFLNKVSCKDAREILVELKFNGKDPALTDVKRISKPGLRVYKGKSELPRVLGGLGIAIISTPKGVLTDKIARKEGVGGEILAFVW